MAQVVMRPGPAHLVFWVDPAIRRTTAPDIMATRIADSRVAGDAELAASRELAERARHATDAATRRYVEFTRQLIPMGNLGGITISVLIVAWMWGDWPRFAIAVGLTAFLLAFNILVTQYLAVARFGPKIELPRAIVNTVVSAIGNALLGWPLVVWFWLPISAILFDQQDAKHTLTGLLLMYAIQDAAALLCGVPIAMPIAFTVLGLVCFAVSNARVAIIREMVVRAHDQQEQLARALDSLKAEVATRERVELELRQAQKLEAIGRLAGGVAHEINTPMQFIGNSVQFVAEGMPDLLAMAGRYLAIAGATAADGGAGLEAIADVDLPYLTEHIPKALAAASDGVRRVANIVSSLKQFVVPTAHAVAIVDVNDAVRTALTLTRHEYDLVAEVEARLGDVPPILGNAGELNQVLLHILVNAAQAIGDVVGARGRGRITVATAVEGASVAIAITDTGGGISPDHRQRVFEPFFTTKQFGRGNGQGLALSRAMIEHQGGTVTFDSKLGVGTTFYVRLPLRRDAGAITA
jgi:signal transduction histidine kinase